MSDSPPPLIRLLRLHQPTGIWLLMWPCLWSYVMAMRGEPELHVILLFIAGAAVMRAAGCIINDLTDRKLDKLVMRTHMRPLASGEISVRQALLILAVLLIIALIIAASLGWQVVCWSAAALPLVILYPWMKRITWWPQLFLGLTFNWGALIGWVAATGSVDLPAILLYLGGICWTIGYDTIYAHQDREDDIRVGIKSTARIFGQNTYRWLWIFFSIASICWFLSGYKMGLGGVFLISLAGVSIDFIIQIKRLDIDNPMMCRHLFMHNGYLGAVLLAGIWLDG